MGGNQERVSKAEDWGPLDHLRSHIAVAGQAVRNPRSRGFAGNGLFRLLIGAAFRLFF